MQFAEFAEQTGALLMQNHLDRALKRDTGNQYFQHKEPWKDESGAATCVYMSVNAVRCYGNRPDCIYRHVSSFQGSLC